MQEFGLIYVVIAVLTIILLGIGSYLIYIDIKLKKLEKEMDDDKRNLNK